MYMPTTCCTTKTTKKFFTFFGVYGVIEIRRMNCNILLHSIKQPGLEMERECVFFEVGTTFLITI
jgi:hypothetical protein